MDLSKLLLFKEGKTTPIQVEGFEWHDSFIATTHDFIEKLETGGQPRLDDYSLLPKENLTMTQYFDQYIFTASRWNICLETALAETHGVPVRRIDVRGLATKPIWDYSEYKAWTWASYEKASLQIEQWEQEEESGSVPIANSCQQEPAWK